MEPDWKSEFYLYGHPLIRRHRRPLFLFGLACISIALFCFEPSPDEVDPVRNVFAIWGLTFLFSMFCGGRSERRIRYLKSRHAHQRYEEYLQFENDSLLKIVAKIGLALSLVHALIYLQCVQLLVSTPEWMSWIEHVPAACLFVVLFSIVAQSCNESPKRWSFIKSFLFPV